MSKWQVIEGDCLKVLPTLKERIDAVVTDPPYGIAYEASRYQNARFAGVIQGDDKPFDPRPILAISPRCVIWGGNNFAELLPRGGWLCWDKRCNEAADRILGSPFELAWCSDPQKFRMLRLQHGGAISADGEARVHPTQKPVYAMQWAMDVCGVPVGATVLDPYCGSGTTGVACMRTGRNFIGIEIDPGYAAIARRRIGEAANHLFAGGAA